MMTKQIKQNTAISQNSHWNPSIIHFILAVGTGNAIFYQGPLHSFAFANLNHSSVNGVLILGTLFFLVAFVAILVFPLIGLISHRLLKRECCHSYLKPPSLWQSGIRLAPSVSLVF
jgi:hypothetical protein